jgi:predicted Zn-dependent protease with MMP-like domain
MPPLSEDRFEALVVDALDQLPEPLAELMDNVVVVIEDRHDEEPELLGLYEGVPLTEREATVGSSCPTGSPSFDFPSASWHSPRTRWSRRCS